MSRIMECPEEREDFLLLIKNNSSNITIVKAYAKWCKPCKKIAPFVLNCFNKLSDNKLLIELDIDKADDVASYLRITSLPTLLAYVKGVLTHVLMSSKSDDIIKFFKKCGLSDSLDFNATF